jgi:membrane-bound serine protease (ClpP class)
MLLVGALVALFLLPQPWGLACVAVALVLEVAELVLWKRFLRRYRLRTGPETLIGARATVVAACAPRGRVNVRGELWNARSDADAAVGERVLITARDGLTLHVEPDR